MPVWTVDHDSDAARRGARTSQDRDREYHRELLDLDGPDEWGGMTPKLRTQAG